MEQPEVRHQRLPQAVYVYYIICAARLLTHRLSDHLVVRGASKALVCGADQPPGSLLWRVLVYVVVDLAAYGMALDGSLYVFLLEG